MVKTTFDENLATLGDWVSFEPFDGRKTEMKLSRTKVEIFLFKGGSFKKSPCLLHFRGIGENSRYELNLIEKSKGSYYEMKSVGDTPFLHNGTPTFHSLVRRNDRIDIEFNRFTIKGEDDLSETEDLPLQTWPKDMFVTLEGETGTGKTTLAKELHNSFVGELSPFVHINLSAFSENLLESELFGHDKGAFTGATRDRRGAIERAGKGTLFIDEIDSLPLHLQVKLLTFLDDGTYQKVGGERFLKSQCRLIFASGRPLKKLAQQKLIREDLYFRLSSGFLFKISPLRNDLEKIETIMNDFEFKNLVTISEPLRQFYRQHQWPGNIRQLNSYLQRKMYEDPKTKYLRLSEKEAESEIEDIQSFWSNNSVISLEQLKRKYCQSVLLKNKGSVEIASKQLGVAKSTLRRLAS